MQDGEQSRAYDLYFTRDSLLINRESGAKGRKVHREAQRRKIRSARLAAKTDLSNRKEKDRQVLESQSPNTP